MIRNTFLLRCSLVQHLFTHVLPLPLPLPKAAKAVAGALGGGGARDGDGGRARRRCFWRRHPMRYETQADLLRLLQVCGGGARWSFAAATVPVAPGRPDLRARASCGGTFSNPSW